MCEVDLITNKTTSLSSRNLVSNYKGKKYTKVASKWDMMNDSRVRNKIRELAGNTQKFTHV